MGRSLPGTSRPEGSDFASSFPRHELPHTLHAYADDEIARYGWHGAGTERDGIQVGRDVAEREGLVRNFDCWKRPMLDSPQAPD